MQQVRKKQRRPLRHGRLILLLVLTGLLAAGAALYLHMNQPVREEDIPDAVSTAGQYIRREDGEVARIAITLRSGEGYVLLQTEPGVLTLEGNAAWVVDPHIASETLRAVSTIAYSSVLSDDPAEYAAHLADFGLDHPRVVAEVTYTDGVTVTLRIGDRSVLTDESSFYLLIDGDPRLLTMDRGTAEMLDVELTLLHPLTQPVLHKARIDCITLTGSDGEVIRWELNALVTDSDAAERWTLTSPFRYPADAGQMSALLESLGSLYLGAYVCEATPDTLTQYGFDAPRLTIRLHHAPGTTSTINEHGEFELLDWPDSTLQFTVGSARSDMVDYVLCEGAIYLMSRFKLAALLNLDPMSTVSRYPVLVPLGMLDRLTVEEGGQTRTWQIIRTEQVAANNDLVYDEHGNVVYDLSCTLDGKPFPYAGFEGAYNALLVATVSGRLPEGWTPAEPVRVTYTFVSRSGATHTVALAPFDALHDAVIVDGHALFYIIRTGFAFDPAG